MRRQRLEEDVSQIFDISGPFKVPLYKGTAGRIVDRETVAGFWDHHRPLQNRHGCYVFGMRAGKGYTPIYVGKAAKSFKQECFTDHKLAHYNKALADYVRGTPVLFFVSLPRGRGRTNTRAIGKLEKYLITTAEIANPNLSNVQNRARDKWGIRGFLRSGKGKPSAAAKAFRQLMSP